MYANRFVAGIDEEINSLLIYYRQTLHFTFSEKGKVNCFNLIN